MELFAVNRYHENDSKGQPKDEIKILNKLLEKVENRKRKLNEAVVKIKKEPKQKENNEDEGQNLKKSKIIVSKKAKIDLNIAPTESDEDSQCAFTVLGDDVTNKQCLESLLVLPSWLANPKVISTNISLTESANDIENVSYLQPYVRGTLKEMNISHLFPVQTAVIPYILEAHNKPKPFRPRDICVSAPTGSGKTLAFAIPIVQVLSQRVLRKIQALVVLPVAELALQVFRVFKKLCGKTDLTVCLLSNQTPFQVEQSRLVEDYKGEYFSLVDIVVTTPGRLVEHLHATKGFCLKSLKFIVIDEADRIMDSVFHNWLYHLDAHVRTVSNQLLSGQSAPLCYNELETTLMKSPHKLLFSATLSQDPEKLQNLRLFQPKLFTSVLSNFAEFRNNDAIGATNRNSDVNRSDFIGKFTTPAELTEKFCITESRLKPLTLFCLIKEHAWTKFLCFTNSVESSGRLAFVLKMLFQKTLVIEEISASVNAKERSQILSSFSRGKINGVVCSDALARGIDIPDVDIVISYDPPRHITTYIHRIGRTARAGRQGTAITLLASTEQKAFNEILAEAGKIVTEELQASTKTEEAHAQEYSLALEALRKKITKEKRIKLLVKERAKENSVLHKDLTKMTLMEKLQAQASTQVHTKTDVKSVPQISRRYRKKQKSTKQKRK